MEERESHWADRIDCRARSHGCELGYCLKICQEPECPEEYKYMRYEKEKERTKT